jgi:hypothetical protein
MILGYIFAFVLLVVNFLFTWASLDDTAERRIGTPRPLVPKLFFVASSVCALIGFIKLFTDRGGGFDLLSVILFVAGLRSTETMTPGERAELAALPISECGPFVRTMSKVFSAIENTLVAAGKTAWGIACILGSVVGVVGLLVCLVWGIHAIASLGALGIIIVLLFLILIK